MDIEIYEYSKMNISNSLLITGFPTVGLIGTIATRFIVYSLNLKLIGALLSDYFPPVSIISGGEPLPPVRFYGEEKTCGPNGKYERLVVMLSEFVPHYSTLRPMANKMIDWCKENNCRSIICMEGFNLEERREDIPLLGVGSTNEARKMLERYGVKIMEEGMVSGISGILLYEGKRRNFDVSCILAGTHAEYPDAKAAAKVLEIVNKMLPDIKIDPEPLYKEAEKIEEQIKAHMEKAKPTKSLYTEPMMYG
jgi:uncharacterized protein